MLLQGHGFMQGSSTMLQSFNGCRIVSWECEALIFTPTSCS